MEKCRRNSVCQRIGFFLTMKVLENTPAVLSLGKLCDETGIPTNGSMVCQDSTQALEVHTPPQGSVAANGDNRRLVPHECLPQVALPFRRMCGKCPDAARLHHQRAEKTWQQDVDRLWSEQIVWFLPAPTTRTRRNLQHRRSHSGALRMRSRRLLGSAKHYHGAQSAHSNTGWLIFSPPLLSQDAVRLWMCV